MCADCVASFCQEFATHDPLEFVHTHGTPVCKATRVDERACSRMGERRPRDLLSKEGRFGVGAQGRIRTGTAFRPADFKSAASTLPPPGRAPKLTRAPSRAQAAARRNRAVEARSDRRCSLQAADQLISRLPRT